MLQIADAIQATTPGRARPSSPLGESEAGPATAHADGENYGVTAGDLQPGPRRRPWRPAANTFAPAFFTGSATVSFSSPTLTVPAGGTATVDVTITPNRRPGRPEPLRRLCGADARRAAASSCACPTPASRATTSRIQVLVPDGERLPLARPSWSATSYVNQPDRRHLHAARRRHPVPPRPPRPPVARVPDGGPRRRQRASRSTRSSYAEGGVPAPQQQRHRPSSPSPGTAPGCTATATRTRPRWSPTASTSS